MPATMRRPKGIIFDFDGVLVDTEWAIYQSWVHLYAREGQEISIATYAPCLGAGYSHWDPAAHLEKLTGKSYDWDVETPARQAMLEADLERMGLMEGAAELFSWCREQGIGLTVASSSSRRWVQGWLEKLGIYELFDGVFTRTDGYPVKPNPALFLAAQNDAIPCVAIPNRMTESSDFFRAACRCASLRELLQHLKASC